MKRLSEALHAIAVTLWVGSIWAIGAIAAPVLFATLQDRAIAGTLAGKMFSIVAYIGIACGAYLVLFRILRFRLASLKQIFFWIVLFMLALTLASRFGIQPIMTALREQELSRSVVESIVRDRFAMWHGIASGLYLILCALGLLLVINQRSALK